MDIVRVKAGENKPIGVSTTEDQIVVVKQPEIEQPSGDDKPLTDAELEKRRQELAEVMWGEKPAKPAEVAPAPAQEAPAAPEEAPKPAEAPAAPAAAPAPEVKPEPTTQEIISQTAKAVGEEVRNAMESDKPAPAAEHEPEQMSVEDAEMFLVIQKMEELGTAKRGQADEFKKFALSRYAREDNWLAANPGKEYNPDDPEHEEFYKNQPDIDEGSAERARTKLLVESEIQEGINKALAPIREKELLAEAQPKMRSEVVKTITDVLGRVSESVSKVATVNGALDFSEANIARMVDADPVAAAVLEPLIMQEVAPLVMELEKTKIDGLNYYLDPQRNPTHAAIARHAEDLEKKLSGTSRDGKKYISIADFNRQITEIESGKGTEASKQNKVKALNDRHFIITPDDLKAHIVDTVCERAKAQIEHIDKIAQKKYKNGAPPPAPKPAATTPAVQSVPPPADTTPKPPPSAGSQTESVDSQKPDANAAKKLGESVVTALFGR